MVKRKKRSKKTTMKTWSIIVIVAVIALIAGFLGASTISTITGNPLVLWQTESISECIDSDEGKNLGEKGFCRYGKFTHTDVCRSDDYTLLEHYCIKGEAGCKEKEYGCSNGCCDGRCMNYGEKCSIPYWW